jgi:NADH-quinone oxidoreductase subunit L
VTELVAGFSPSLAPYIVGLPLGGAALLLLAGSRLRRFSGVLATATISLAFLLGLVQFVRVAGAGEGAQEATVRLFEWIVAGDFAVGADLLVDRLSMVMVLVVGGVGALIHVYSIAYMRGDPGFHRYFAYLNLFAASMLLLVLADNLLLLYVGWEGVGLCSYLLIGFWFERPAAHNAAKKAFLVNRIGDFAFLLGILLLSFEVGNLTIGRINEAAGAVSAGVATVASLLLFAGATGKSAQIPLYVWLPDAMEGPTPVSALIHAATMVTAGVYVVVRFSHFFEASGDAALATVAWIGGTTALLAALMASVEYDIKRVLAYSTISQLGYMFLAAGVGAYAVAIFHLITHAFFKALMFLGAGAVMHALDGETDLRRMGGLRKSMPLVGWTFAGGWLAISGVFPFAGFFSKDAILASAWEEANYVLYAVGLFTALLTAFYMSRLYLRVFEGPERTPGGVHGHDAPRLMAVALVPLAVLSLVGGVINLPEALTLEHFLAPVVGEAGAPEAVLAFALGGAALVTALAGILIARYLYMTKSGARTHANMNDRFGRAILLVRHKFYVDEFYGLAIVAPSKRFARFCADVVDVRVIDGLVNGSARFVATLGEGLRRLQTGYVRNYAVTFLIGVVVVLSVLLARVNGV